MLLLIIIILLLLSFIWSLITLKHIYAKKEQGHAKKELSKGRIVFYNSESTKDT